MGEDMIQQIDDFEAMNQLIKHPRIWTWVADDNCEKSAFELPQDKFYVGAIDNGKLAGFFMVEAMNTVTAQIHMVINPIFWGYSILYVKEFFSWMFENTVFKKIVAFIPNDNALAIKLAVKSGMEKEGAITKSFLRNGELKDQHIFGISGV